MQIMRPVLIVEALQHAMSDGRLITALISLIKRYLAS